MGQMELSNAELHFWDWLLKINERVTFIILNVKDKRDISDSDYALLKILFRPFHNGEYPLYQSKMEGTEIMATQTGLFKEQIEEENTTSTDKS
jgi:hypothetical protein